MPLEHSAARGHVCRKAVVVETCLLSMARRQRAERQPVQALRLHRRSVTGDGGVQGYGTLLMEEAERIARGEHRSNKLAVISGVGTRHYYRKLGYHLEGHYMVQHLR